MQIIGELVLANVFTHKLVGIVAGRCTGALSGHYRVYWFNGEIGAFTEEYISNILIKNFLAEMEKRR